MTTRHKYWLHISSTNQATSQVNTASSPQTARNFGLAAADVLLLHERPGVVEMCVPSKLTSYFAAGRPVLAATSGRSAAAHEIQASGAGIIVEPGNPAALLEALRSLTGQPSLDELGQRGQAYARERLSENAALDAYRDWAAGLLSRTSRP